MGDSSVEIVRDWDGRQMRVDRSPGGVLLFCNVDDALIRNERACWPPPQVVMKMGAAQHGGKLPESVQEKLGHFSALQSVNFEDAVTWNFFGGLINRPSAAAEFLNWLCVRLELPWAGNSAAITVYGAAYPTPTNPSRRDQN